MEKRARPPHNTYMSLVSCRLPTHPRRRAAGVIVAVIMLAACGQTGPLYRPGEGPSTNSPPASSNPSSTDDAASQAPASGEDGDTGNPSEGD